jgi:hypothetical protein
MKCDDKVHPFPQDLSADAVVPGLGEYTSS